MGKFKLRQFVVSRCHIDSLDLDGLAEIPFLEVWVMNDWQRIDQNFQTAEELYSKGEFQRAVSYYDASTFAKPSAQKYLQRARCLLALGLRDRAIQSCNLVCLDYMAGAAIRVKSRRARQIAAFGKW